MSDGTVLVVDDNSLIGMLLGDLLTAMGYNVSPIQSSVRGAEASAQRCCPILMIVDINLVDGSAFSAVGKILRSGYIAHIFLSGDVHAFVQLQPESVFLQKPFLEADLALPILKATSNARLSGSLTKVQ